MVLGSRAQRDYATEDDTVFASENWKREASFKGLFLRTCRTSTQQTDGTEQPCLCIVHLQRKELVGEGKNQIGEGTEAGVVHLVSV